MDRIKKHTGSSGIFGVPEAYDITIEEQGRKILHAHTHVWIKDFNIVRNVLYHEDEKVKKGAKKEMLLYIDKVMSSNYDGLYLSKEEDELDNTKKKKISVNLKLWRLMKCLLQYLIKNKGI